MNKDVIYIDVEDDITAIISKIKASKEKIVALVPPKRIGILQSAVNMRLLARTASSAGKRVVIITGNQALIGLAAAASIPIARNLQSKPELAEIPALSVDNDDDIIDGSQIPVGTLVGAAVAATGGREIDDDTLTGVDVENVGRDNKRSAPLPLNPKKIIPQKGQKIPNFNSFRKRLFIGIGAGSVLVGVLVWAIWFAPAATVVITAKTAPVSVNGTVTLTTEGATDVDARTITAVRQAIEKDASVEFDATGTEDRGQKATGQVALTIACSDIESDTPTIPAGTGVSSGGLTFITQSTVSLDTAVLNPCRFTGSVKVTAQQNGEQYNLQSGASYTVAGFADVSGTGSAMTGGVSKIVTIVTAADVQKASEQLASEEDPTVKKQLADGFAADVMVIDSSYSMSRSDPVASPGVGQEVSGKARLTTKATYVMMGISEKEINSYLDASLESEIGDSSQKIYENGRSDIIFRDYALQSETEARVRLSTTGRIGPEIDEAQIKDQVKGRRFGDIQSSLQAIEGISDVDVKFSYFWVRVVPENPEKITVEFKLEDV